MTKGPAIRTPSEAGFWLHLVAWGSICCAAIWAFRLLPLVGTGSLGLALLMGNAPTAIAVLFAFAMFGLGVRAASRFSLECCLWFFVISGISCYGMLAVVGPTVRYEIAESLGRDVDATTPLGPETPAVLTVLRHRVIADPPDNYSLQVEKPFARPPAWLDFLVQLPFAIGIFAVVNGTLGVLGLRLTSDLEIRSRLKRVMSLAALWGVSAAGFTAPLVLVSTSVRQLDAQSATAGWLWLGLATPIFCTLAVAQLLRRRGWAGANVVEMDAMEAGGRESGEEGLALGPRAWSLPIDVPGVATSGDKIVEQDGDYELRRRLGPDQVSILFNGYGKALRYLGRLTRPRISPTPQSQSRQRFGRSA